MDVRVADHASKHRYELTLDGSVAGTLFYQDRDGQRILVHTEVDPGHEGEGLGSTLVRSALDDIRARGLKLVVVCPFVRKYLERHPEQKDLGA